MGSEHRIDDGQVRDPAVAITVGSVDQIGSTAAAAVAGPGRLRSAGEGACDWQWLFWCCLHHL